MMSTLTTECVLSDKDQHDLMEVARRGVTVALDGRPALQPMVDSYAIPLRRLQSSFVVIRNHGQMIRCAGTIEPKVALVSDVSRNAHQAGCDGIELESASELTVEVLTVSPLRCLVARTLPQVLQCLEPGRHGVLLQYQGRDATFTPDKWETWPDKVEFMQQLRRQAGLAPDMWSPDIRISLYTLQQLPPVRLSCAATHRAKPK